MKSQFSFRSLWIAWGASAVTFAVLLPSAFGKWGVLGAPFNWFGERLAREIAGECSGGFWYLSTLVAVCIICIKPRPILPIVALGIVGVSTLFALGVMAFPGSLGLALLALIPFSGLVLMCVAIASVAEIAIRGMSNHTITVLLLLLLAILYWIITICSMS